MPADFSDRTARLVTAGHRNEAVKMFFAEGMGIPSFIVTLMRWLMLGWSKMAAAAHTIPYDLAILAGTQDGKPLPAGRWAGCRTPTLVMVGSKSESFFHTGAKALVTALPNARYASLEGRDHSAVMMRPGDLDRAITSFLLNPAP